MKSNLWTGLLLSVSLLPSLLFAQESEFVEDRSNTVVEYVESDQKPTESTATVVKDNDVKKSDIIDSLNSMKIFLGAHFGGSFAMPLGMTMADDVRNNSEEANATWIGAKASVGAALGFYFNRKMALVTGLDYQMLYYKTTDQVPRNRVITVTMVAFDNQLISESKSVEKTNLQNRTIIHSLLTIPVSFRYHFLDEVWGQLGVGLDWVFLGKNVYECAEERIVHSFYNPSDVTYPVTAPQKKEFIPSLLLSVGKSWTLGKWNLDAALSFSYALKKIDFDYGLSANTFTIGLDFYAWYSLTKEKK